MLYRAIPDYTIMYYYAILCYSLLHKTIQDLDYIVEARKLEHQYPHAVKVQYRGS